MRANMKKAFTALKSLNWPRALGVSFFLGVVLMLVQSVYWVSDWLVEHRDAQIKTLTVLGDPLYTEEKDIVNAIKKTDLTSFFQLNVKAVQAAVRDLPWVASVSVRKQWPDTIQVYVVEHKPVAYWNSDSLLNTNGTLFEADSNKLSASLPQLYGPEGSEGEAWETFLQLKEMLAVNSFELTSLALSERFAWQLWLKNGIKLNLGREEKAKRVQRFIDVYPLLKRPDGALLDVIDLRYDTGLAVSWRYPQVQEKKDKSKA
ncbi:cell division protein FtsQ/DivIB [Pseudoalteromonas luteoviolacea]|uniref:cell division protein FtsQ/DivIB n=1 Tax=Pseudoalteromonas luteoviolacea TaxID=43657 RepID=UPI001F27D9CF|nr:cell division protein FtsQ/DivIB [Pseudoalteromonas luteoviolacea]MCF6439083.1 cell division protein FtsQ/DivIB [Pseudoalteromonas luteoviolacea]